MLESAQDAALLSEVRFKAGTTGYFEVLTNETNSFSAELGLAQAQANELVALTSNRVPNTCEIPSLAATNHATDSVATFLDRSLH